MKKFVGVLAVCLAMTTWLFGDVTYIESWGVTLNSSADGSLDGPKNITADTDGNIYVSEVNNDRISKFSSTGEFLLKWGSEGGGSGQFNEVIGIAYLDNKVYTLDKTNKNVQIFSTSGAFIDTLDDRDVGFGGFVDIADIRSTPEGNIVIYDRGIDTLAAFYEGDSFDDEYDVSDVPSTSQAFTLDRSGNIYFTDSDNNVYKYSDTGFLLDTFTLSGDNSNTALGIATSYSEGFVVLDTDQTVEGDKAIELYDSSGTLKNTYGTIGTGTPRESEGTFTNGHGLFFQDSTGILYVADTDNDRVSLLRLIDPVTSVTANQTEYDLTLNWDNPGDSDFEAVQVRRSTSGYPETIYDGTSVTTNATEGTVVAEGLTITTHYFSLFAVSDSGFTSPPVTFSYTVVDVTPPGPVSALSADVTENNVELAWIPPEDSDFETVMIRRSTTEYPTEIYEGTLVDAVITANDYVDTSLIDGTYYYSVFAADINFNYSEPVTASVFIDNSNPGTPTEFTATPSGDTMLLSWTNPIDGDLSHSILKRSTADYPTALDDGVTANSNISGESYQDEGLTDGIYYYSLFVIDLGDNASERATISAEIDTVAPESPTSLALTASYNIIDLTWTNPLDDDFDSIVIRRSTDNYPSTVTSGIQVSSNITATTYSDTLTTDNITYYYAVYAIDGHENYSAPVTGAIYVNYAPPATPEEPSAIATESTVILTWDNPTDEDFARITIRRSTENYPISTTDGTTANAGITGEEYHDEDLSDDTYYYSFFAIDVANNVSSPATASAIVNVNPPDTPSSLAIATSYNVINLSWTNPSNDDFDSIMIRRSTSDYPLTVTSGVQASTNISASTYEDSGITDNRTYYYAVYAVDTFENYSTPVTGSIYLNYANPAAPTELLSTVSENTVILTWDNPTDEDFARITIKRSTENYPASINAGTTANAGITGQEFRDEDLSDNTYYYSLFAVDLADNVSSPATTSAIVNVTPPDTPSSLAITTSYNIVTLSWTNPANDDFDSITIRRSTADYPLTATSGILATSNLSAETYQESTLTDNRTYFYSVFAKDSNGNFSTPVTANVELNYTIPSTPTSPSANVSGNMVTLTWNNPDDEDFAWISIKRSTDSYPATLSDGVTANGNITGQEYRDEDLSDDIYYYAIFAVDLASNISLPATVSATINATPPDTPGSFAITSSYNAAELSWTNPTNDDFDSIMIRRSTSDYPVAITSGTLITQNSTASTYRDTTLTENQTYFYAIFAKDSNNNFSSPVTGDIELNFTPPSTPTSPSAEASGNMITLTWNNPSDEDFAWISIKRSTTGYPAALSDGVTANGNITGQEYRDELLSEGTYYYSIFAIDTAQNASTPVTASATVDTSGPSAPTSLAATVSQNTTALSWNNPTEDDFSYVMIRRNSIQAELTASLLNFPETTSEGDLVTTNYTGTNYTDEDLEDGTHYYTIFAADTNDNFSIAATVSVEISTSTDTEDDDIVATRPLNYPNPFRMRTQHTDIGFTLNADSDVELQIYSNGGLVYKETYSNLSAGYQLIRIDANEIGEIWPAGIYPYVLIIDGKVEGAGKLGVLP